MGVFPTRVGVFPFVIFSSLINSGLPHAGGGVSVPVVKFFSNGVSSPRGWGCFRGRHLLEPLCAVFPTRVGVFLPPRGGIAGKPRLPHAGGGVSGDFPGE